MMTRVSQFSTAGDAAALGEGPYWHRLRGTLLWVDIRAGVLFEQRHPATPARRWQLPEQVSAVVEGASGRLVLTGQQQLFALLPELPTRAHEVIANLTAVPPGHRCNDAACDPWGNLWFGTMDDAEETTDGSLWCLSRTGRLVRQLRGIGIPNTLAWDERRGRMYFADSARGELYAFDCIIYDELPELGACSVFVGQETAPGVPDGSALDTDGVLLNARWGGAGVARFSPEGRYIDHIDVPAACTTSCCFGGPELDRLYITSARSDDSGSSGHVFCATGTGVGRGVPTVPWGGSGITEVVDNSRRLEPNR